jgi:uncharacterized membrane protein YgcG
VELLIIVLIVGAAVWAFSAWSTRRRRQEEEAASLAAVRGTTGEDVTRLGEDVAALDTATAGTALDEATTQDYRRALDAYDSAKSALERMQRPEDARAVTEALEDGRYAVACVRARLAGEPIPVRRPPCFFNPQHGPSTEDVEWAPPGGLPRQVPVCAADAERVKLGAEPDTRKVLVGNTRRPYWEAGPAYSPWAQGYFGGYAMSGLLPGVLLGAVLGSSFGGWDGGYEGSGDDGDGGDGGDAGDGGESGDGDFGGGDFGGGDFGG